jgi:hypothetical protein
VENPMKKGQFSAFLLVENSGIQKNKSSTLHKSLNFATSFFVGGEKILPTSLAKDSFFPNSCKKVLFLIKIDLIVFLLQ